MVFNSVTFLIFLAITLSVYYRLGHKGQNWLLLVASYIFYGWWDYRFCSLLFFTSALDYWLGAQIAKTDRPAARRTLLILSLVSNLGLLGFFKYYNFFVATAINVAQPLGWRVDIPFIELGLPIAISFLTFHALSYIIDVYHRKLQPTRSLVDILFYISFFPHLIAGPIVRAKAFLEQTVRRSDPADIRLGLSVFLIVGGLFKKVIVANYLSTDFVDGVFRSPSEYSRLDLLLGMYAYAIQIYCDFSAYTDMAIALAALVGFRFPANFNQPYRAQRLREFWQRWHISLSTWLRDYLYKPLGGNRHGHLKTYRNLIVTMLLGGIWHGAGWKFLMWGAMHGGGLAVERMLEPWLGRRSLTPAGKTIATVTVFHFVCLAWIFFRAEDFEVARLYIAGLGSGWGQGVQQAGPFVIGLIALGMALQFLPERWFDHLADAFGRAPAWGLGAVAGVVVAIINALGPEGIAPFIYFRF